MVTSSINTIWVISKVKRQPVNLFPTLVSQGGVYTYGKSLWIRASAKLLNVYFFPGAECTKDHTHNNGRRNMCSLRVFLHRDLWEKKTRCENLCTSVHFRNVCYVWYVIRRHRVTKRRRESACITNDSLIYNESQLYRLSTNYANYLASAYLARKKTCIWATNELCQMWLWSAFGRHRLREIKASRSSLIVQISWPTMMTGW